MPLDRRKFLTLMAASAASSLVVSNPLARAAALPKIRAIAFDGFTVFDPRPVFALTEALFPEKGAELSNAWHTRQFEYAWLRTLTGCYVDFWHVTEDTLVFTAKTLKLDLSPEKRRQIMHAYLEIKAWPDAPPALRPQKDVGIQMAFLSNFTAAMLDAAVKNAVILLLRTTSIKSLSCHWAPPALWR